METVRLLKHAESQVVRLPDEFRFEGDQVLIKKMGTPSCCCP